MPPADVRFRVGVSQKLREATGWEPKYDMDAIIEDTYQFVSSVLGTPASGLTAVTDFTRA